MTLGLLLSDPTILNALLALVIALFSGGISVKYYESRLARQKEKEQGDSQYKIAMVSDSSALVEKLLPQIDKLFQVERELMTEKLLMVNEIENFKRQILTLNLEKIEAEEQIKIVDVEVSKLQVDLTNANAEIERLNAEVRKLHGLNFTK